MPAVHVRGVTGIAAAFAVGGGENGRRGLGCWGTRTRARTGGLAPTRFGTQQPGWRRQRRPLTAAAVRAAAVLICCESGGWEWGGE